MPPVGKELEQQPVADTLAVREVEGYIERIEKQAETQSTDNSTQSQPTPKSQVQVQDTSKTTMVQLPKEEKAKIILPLNKEEIEKGAKATVFEGIKWLTEWCILMIKKYPGRVFYSPTTQKQ